MKQLPKGWYGYKFNTHTHYTCTSSESYYTVSNYTKIQCRTDAHPVSHTPLLFCSDWSRTASLYNDLKNNLPHWRAGQPGLILSLDRTVTEMRCTQINKQKNKITSSKKCFRDIKGTPKVKNTEYSSAFVSVLVRNYL